MNDWRYKIRMFLTALFISFGGILPAASCSGGCGPCLNCAGVGGVMAVLAAIGTARKKGRRERDHRALEAGHRSLSEGKMGKTVSGVT